MQAKVALYNYIQPLEATLFAWILLDEPVTLAVAAGASYLPARRITRVDPLEARRPRRLF